MKGKKATNWTPSLSLFDCCRYKGSVIVLDFGVVYIFNVKVKVSIRKPEDSLELSLNKILKEDDFRSFRESLNFDNFFIRISCLIQNWLSCHLLLTFEIQRIKKTIEFCCEQLKSQLRKNCFRGNFFTRSFVRSSLINSRCFVVINACVCRLFFHHNLAKFSKWLFSLSFYILII